jgi:hypothetical protein
LQEKIHEQNQKSSLAQTPRESQEAQRKAKGAEGRQHLRHHNSSAAITPRFLFYRLKVTSSEQSTLPDIFSLSA